MARLKPGDVFEVKIKGKKHYFQYLTNDSNCLNGNVIRCFDIKIDIEQPFDINSLINTKVSFFDHTLINLGIKLKFWEKVGNLPLPKDFKMPFFRSTPDSGARVEKSYKWYIWEPSGEEIFIGELKQEYASLPYAAVSPPLVLVEQIETGIDKFKRPS